MRRLWLALLLAACGGAPHPSTPKARPPADVDPQGTHHAAVAAQLQPMVDGEVVTSIVVGLYDGGRLEVYGFGKGPGGKPPDGQTLYEIGSVTKVYTSLLLADAVQRREVTLDEPVADLLPPGITVPTRDKVAITLHHLSLHNSGLPRLPPLIAARATSPDPYAGYGEDALLSDLLHTQLEATPGTKVVYSNYGAGLLGFALGRKIGGGYAGALAARVIGPLGLHDTFVGTPQGAEARVATGTDPDLKPVPGWKFDALAGAGALVSTARDQLALIDAELDAVAGSRRPLRAAMRLTQEPQLDNPGDNEGLGWQIDSAGRFWHNGGTGGYHSFIGFDPKTRRGVVVLASTSVSVVDHVAQVLYKILDGTKVAAPVYPTAAQLADYTGNYDFGGMKLVVSAAGTRLYIEGPGAPKYRIIPLTDAEFWIEPLQAVIMFQRDRDKVARAIFLLGDHQMSATKE